MTFVAQLLVLPRRTWSKASAYFLCLHLRFVVFIETWPVSASLKTNGHKSGRCWFAQSERDSAARHSRRTWRTVSLSPHLPQVGGSFPTMPTPSHSSSLIQTPQAKRPWRQMQAASTPRTATLTAGVSP
ncbi:uncharacterized protein [Dermacentor albipictus]|uniref:uncharacterized protein isoform X2 n=1 Tax=Dermacentor albipictus TaxID=60249 RepID=UPI0038FC9E08